MNYDENYINLFKQYSNNTIHNTRAILANGLEITPTHIEFKSGFRMPIDSFERMCKQYLSEHEPEELV